VDGDQPGEDLVVDHPLDYLKTVALDRIEIVVE
jgi:hypothetical protein